ncbi:MAG TPA: 23S rRNA (pseudouridine(1915)-N(3))-methyltransferase RlmH [Pyrinomonadaceae bacterium]|nr:23S rRNA (pseudouridine(1915)-N(3))-methyltransferase RlmH [Pyrinomonadaceae bacterium]
MKLRFIWPGKTKDERLRSLIEEYVKRLSHFTRCEVVEVKESRTRDAAALNKESQRLLEASSDSTLLVLLDLNGRDWSSQQLAGQVRKWENDSVKEVAVVIGGPEGLSPEMQSRANVRWRLSRLTLTHEMARVLVVEQLYRAYAINRGLPYQK